MDEGRKRVLLIAAAILAARKISQIENANSPAYAAAIYDAIIGAERIMRRIDSMFPKYVDAIPRRDHSRDR